MEAPTLKGYTKFVEGMLGAITAHNMHSSKESSKVIRDISKDLDNLSVQLRKELVDFDKQLVANNDRIK